MKRPAFQFYPADWRKDAALQSCSIGARGLWWELCCIMHECVPYGHLCINAVAVDESQAARLCGVELALYRKLVSELERAGVPSMTSERVMFSRRMVKDEHLRTVRAAAGSKGGNPFLLVPKDKQTDNQEDKQTEKQTPTPSSSSSSSSSKPRAPRARRTRCPLDFGISERVKDWAQDKGHSNLNAHFEKFMSYVKTKDPTYADWDEALMTCIRENWAKVPVSVGSMRVAKLPDLPRREGDIPEAAKAVIAKLTRRLP